jgi:hypothetical protein
VRVRIEYTAEVSDDYRRAINAFYGRPGLASRDDVRRWFEAYGASMDDDLSRAMDDAAEGDA